MSLSSILTLAARACSYTLYVGLALSAVSQPFCSGLLAGAGNPLGFKDLCDDLASSLGYALLLLLVLYLLLSFLLWLVWREAAHEMGNVDEHEAVHGLRRGLGVRDLMLALRREMRDLGLLVMLTTLSHAWWFGLSFAVPEHFDYANLTPHLKLLLSSLLLVLASLLLNPVFDVVPLVSRWLRRRVLAGH